MPWQGPLYNYARVVVSSVCKRALELSTGTKFFVSESEVSLGGLQGMFLNGQCQCQKHPSYPVLLGPLPYNGINGTTRA